MEFRELTTFLVPVVRAHQKAGTSANSSWNYEKVPPVRKPVDLLIGLCPKGKRSVAEISSKDKCSFGSALVWTLWNYNWGFRQDYTEICRIMPPANQSGTRKNNTGQGTWIIQLCFILRRTHRLWSPDVYQIHNSKQKLLLNTESCNLIGHLYIRCFEIS